MSIVSKARIFATAAHAAVNQKRKYTGDDYIVHPAELAALIKTFGGTSEMIAAAWLHDTVEDTGVTIELIRREFGDEIGDMVEDLTDVSKPEDGNRRTRKEIDRQHTAQARPQSKTIKLGDLIVNSQEIIANDPDFAVVYMAEKKRLLEVLGEGDPRLMELAQSIVDDYYARRKAA